MRKLFPAFLILALFFMFVYSIGYIIFPTQITVKRRRCIQDCYNNKDEEIESCKKYCIAKFVARQKDIDYLRRHSSIYKK